MINFDNINGTFSLITFFSFNIFSLMVIYFIGEKLYLKTLTVTRGTTKKKEKLENVVNLKNKSSFSMLLKKRMVSY